MKARVVDGLVVDVQFNIPHEFNKDGVIISHYSHDPYTPEDWYNDGWRDCIVPQYNKDTQRLSEVTYNATMDVAECFVISTVYPPIDPETQKLGEKYYDEVNKVDTFYVVDLSEEELQAIATRKAAEIAAELQRKAILTPLAFLNRFTDEESKAIIALTKTNPDVELWWIKYNKAQDIDLLDPQTIGGVQALEYFTIIGVGRANEILTIV